MAVDKPTNKRRTKAALIKGSLRPVRRMKSHTSKPAAQSSSSSNPFRNNQARPSPRDPVIPTTGPPLPLPDCTNDRRLLEEIQRINKLRSRNASNPADSEDELDVLRDSDGSKGSTVATLDFTGGFRGKEKLALAIQLHRPFTVGYDDGNDYMIETSSAEGMSFRLFAYHCESNDRKAVTVSCEDRSQPGLGIIWNGHQIREDTVILSQGDVIEAGQQSFTFHSRTDFTRAWDDDAESDATSHYHYSSRILGEGSHAILSLVWDRKKKSQVACKRFKDTSSAALAKWEFYILKKMRHPNINGILDYAKVPLSKAEVEIRMIVDVAKGGDLFSYIQQHHRSGLGGLDEAQVKWITFQLLRGLDYMHQKGIAHHDIKPENIILITAATSFPHVQIADFGMSREESDVIRAIAKCQKGEATDAAVDEVMRSPMSKETHMGTTIYNPPEYLLHHAKEYPVKEGPGYSPFMVDSWSLGCAVFFLLFQQHPMTAMVNMAHISSEVDPQPVMMAIEARKEEMMLKRGKLKREHVIVLKTILAGLKWELMPRYKPAQSVKSFLGGLCDVDVATRYTIAQALESEWITSSQAQLEEMYRCRVLREERQGPSAAQQ